MQFSPISPLSQIQFLKILPILEIKLQSLSLSDNLEIFSLKVSVILGTTFVCALLQAIQSISNLV